MACSVTEIKICSQDLQEIIIYKTINKDFTSINTIIIFHVFMRKAVLQIWAERLMSDVEFQTGQN